MSDYFGALWRTSMAGGPMPPSELPIEATDTDFAPAAATMVAAATATRPTPGGRVPPEAVVAAEPPVGVAVTRPASIEPDAAASSRRALPEAPEPTLPSRDSIVHAAMRWVAEGALERPSATPLHKGAAAQMPQDTPTPRAAAATPSSAPAAERQEPADIEDRRTAPAVQAHRATPAQPVAVAPSRPPLDAACAAADTVEVRIGAIHLRVDAPPPNVARAVAPVPQRPAAATPPARPALARRALRRL